MKVNFSVLLFGIALATGAFAKNLDLSEITRIRGEISQYMHKPSNVERKLAVVSMNQSSSPNLNNHPVDRYLKPTKTPRKLLNLEDETAPLTQQPLKDVKKEGRILAHSAPAPRMLKDKSSKADKIIVTYVPAKPKSSKKLTSFMQKSSDRQLKLSEPAINKAFNAKTKKSSKTKHKKSKATKIKKTKSKGRHLQQVPEPRKLYDYQSAYPQKRFQNTYYRNYENRGSKFNV